MTSGDNAAAKENAKKVNGEDRLKTLECLRGRLLAERGASKAANLEADKLGNKLIQLENKLKEEIKWRNRAEKRLKLLIKKLESMNIVYAVSEESLDQSDVSSNHSSYMEKSDISSLSSSSTTSLSHPSKQPKDSDKKQSSSQMKNSENCELEEPVKVIEPTLQEIQKHATSIERHSCSPDENTKFDKMTYIRSDDCSHDVSQCSKNKDET